MPHIAKPEAKHSPSPLGGMMGVVLECVGGGRATAVMPWAHVLTNVHGTIHGGAIATLVDIAAAMAARTSDPAASGAITVSLTTNFLMGATGTLRAHAVAANPGRSLVTVNVDVRDEKDCAVATAMAVMKLKRGGPADPEETRR